MPGPDASWWDGLHRDTMPTGKLALEAEVRRLRAELLRVQDTLRDALDSGEFRTLLAAARRAWETAEKALRPRSR